MNLSVKEVLSSKKGIAEALGIMLIGLTVLVTVGVLVANYALLSKSAGELQALSQELTNRAERYAGKLNADLLTPQVPPMGRECSSTPAMCTAIIAATPSADGKQTVLRIQGDTASGVGQTLTKDVTLVSSEVTHVTALDENGKKVWGLSDEGLRYKVWGRASGDPTVVKPADLAGPGIGSSWVSVTDRAGIDSTGALWVWGKNNIGQAGIGSISASPITPAKVPGTTVFRSVVTSDDRAYAIDSTGNAWVWGKNNLGQLGLGHSTNVTKPTKVNGLRMMTFSAGKDNVFGITMAGDLVTSGAAQAGLATTATNTLTKFDEGTKYRDVSASTAGAVALIKADGALNVHGSTYPFTPRAGNYVNVSLGTNSGYALGGTGTLYSFGVGAYGQLGLGATTSVATPTAVMSGTLFASVSGGRTSAFAVDVYGKLYYFGQTAAGALSGAQLPHVSVPTPLLPDSRFRGIAVSDSDFSVALLDTMGNVYGMGTATPGLWPMNYLGPNNQPIRMPVPDGFPSYTWE